MRILSRYGTRNGQLCRRGTVNNPQEAGGSYDYSAIHEAAPALESLIDAILSTSTVRYVLIFAQLSNWMLPAGMMERRYTTDSDGIHGGQRPRRLSRL